MTVANYANLPDYVDSSDSYWVVAKRIGYYFIWSHAVIYLGNNGFVPKVPEFPDDERYPGLVMQQLLKYKLSKKTIGGDLKEMQDTVNGFRAHNTADSIVHWGYFRGGTKDEWIVHHGLKECLAEYNILRVYGYGGDPDLTKMFSDDGNLNTSTLSGSFISDAGPGFEGNAKLMHLAQKVYRKNRRVMRKGKTTTFDVQTVSEIKECLENQNKNPFNIHAWSDAWAGLVLVHPIGFTAYEWNSATNSYDSTFYISVNKPNNNQEEYKELLAYQLYTKQHFGPQATPPIIEFGEIIGNSSTADNWKIWDDNEMWSKFDKSVEEAEKWMFSIQELTPENK